MSNLNTVVLHHPLHSLHWELGESHGPEFIQGLNQGLLQDGAHSGVLPKLGDCAGVHWLCWCPHVLDHSGHLSPIPNLLIQYHSFYVYFMFFLDLQRHNAALTLSAVLHQLHQSKYSICSPLAWYRTILLYRNVHFCP